MSLQLENVSVEDCVGLCQGKYETCRLLFGECVDCSLLRRGSLNRDSNNHWVWTYMGSKISLASSIYNWLNQEGISMDDAWDG